MTISHSRQPCWQLLGYGERISSPWRQHPYTLTDMLSRLFSSQSLSMLLRALNTCSFAIAKVFIRCQNASKPRITGILAPDEHILGCHPPLSNTGGMDKIIDVMRGMYSPLLRALPCIHQFKQYLSISRYTIKCTNAAHTNSIGFNRGVYS